MRDYSGLLEQFSNFVNLVESQGRIPTESDIDFFAEKFLLEPYGFLYPEGRGGAYIYSADYNNKQTGRKVMDKSGESFKDLFDEIVPLLRDKVENTYTKVGDVEEAFVWDPEPISEMALAKRIALDSGMSEVKWNKLSGTEKRNHKSTVEAIKRLAKIKSRLKAYNEEVIPFILRKTMYHPLTAGVYSSETGKGFVTRNVNGKPFQLNSEEELQNFLRSATVSGFPAALHEGLRYIWFQPSPTGQNIKMAVVDVDNPANLPMKQVKAALKFIVKALTDEGHPNIIMFTGNSYQVWFGPKEGGSLGSILDAKNLVKSLLYNPEMLAFKRQTAIDNKVVQIDESVFRANQPVRMFFNLHYPTGEDAKKQFTGLAAVPVMPGDIDKFDPLSNAHPEAVLKHFKRYASIVATFFDTVQIGQDYEDAGEIETMPPCNRLEKRDREHKLLELLSEDHMIQVPSDKISAMVQDEENLVCYVQERGVPAVLHFKATGNIRAGGKVISSTRQRKVKTKISVETEKVKAVLMTKGGAVIYDDYMCRDLERYCFAAGISTLTLVGTIVKRDLAGNNLGSQAVRSILEKKEGIDPMQARLLTFVPHQLADFNGSVAKLDLPTQLQELSKIQTARIMPTLFYPEISPPVVAKVKRPFKSLLIGRKVGSLIAVGEETYKITSKRTILATIVGIDKQSTLWKTDAKSIPPVFIAVTKRHSKFGPIYYIVGKADIALPKEERERLKQLVLGEQKEKLDRDGNPFQFYSNVIPMSARADGLADQIEIIEPTITVEVQYEDIAPVMMESLPFHFRKTDRGVFYRAVPKKLFATPILGGRIVGVREDISPRRTSDIGIDQDPLLLVSGKSPPKGLSLLDVLPNPRRNPAFFGVPESRRIKIGGVYDPEAGTVVGGREANVHLVKDGKDPAEFGKAYQRYKKGEDGFKMFIDDYSLTTFGSDRPYYTITGLGGFYQTAVDDVRGEGADGFRVTSMDGKVEGIRNYAEQLEMQRGVNAAQVLEDSKILATQINRVPGDPNAEIQAGGSYRAYDQNYIDAIRMADEEVGKVMQTKGMSKEDITNMLKSKELMNPPIKQDAWESRVTNYAREYEMWKDGPDPKEPWEMVSQTKFATWELPILEKQRLLREANTAYGLSEADMNAINSRFGEPMTGDLLESILSDLYEEVDENDTGTSTEDL